MTSSPAGVAVYVAAGSNTDAGINLRRALVLLRERFGDLKVSRAYRNAAVGFEGADFINLVVGLHSRESVEEVIAALRAIEAACGRPRSAPKWAPRTMDLDILLYGDAVVSAPQLTLPRPDLLRRPYMLGPLAEIAPHVVHPLAGRTIGDLWRDFDQQAHPLTAVELADES